MQYLQCPAIFDQRRQSRNILYIFCFKNKEALTSICLYLSQYQNKAEQKLVQVNYTNKIIYRIDPNCLSASLVTNHIIYLELSMLVWWNLQLLVKSEANFIKNTSLSQQPGGATTFNITTISIMTLSTTFSITTLSITTLT
jgi:hypothetical protein